MSYVPLNFNPEKIKEIPSLFAAYNAMLEGMKQTTGAQMPDFTSGEFVISTGETWVTPDGVIQPIVQPNESKIQAVLAEISETQTKNSSYMFAKAIQAAADAGKWGGTQTTSQPSTGDMSNNGTTQVTQVANVDLSGLLSKSGGELKGALIANNGFSAGINNTSCLEILPSGTVKTKGALEIGGLCNVAGTLNLSSNGLFISSNHILSYNENGLQIGDGSSLNVNGSIILQDNQTIRIGNVILSKNGIEGVDEPLIEYYHAGNANNSSVDWVMKNATVWGVLDVKGSSSLDSLSVANNLIVNGESTFGNTTVSNLTSDNSTVLGGAVIHDSLSVANSIRGGSLNVSGNTIFGGEMSVDGTVMAKSNFTTSGLANLGRLLVVGATTLSKTLTVAEAATFKSTLTVQGGSTLTSVVATHLTSNVAVVQDSLTVANDITGGSLLVHGSSVFNDALTVAGNVVAKSRLNVQGNTTLDGTLKVGGLGTFDGSITMNNGFVAKTATSGSEVIATYSTASGEEGVQIARKLALGLNRRFTICTSENESQLHFDLSNEDAANRLNLYSATNHSTWDAINQSILHLDTDGAFFAYDKPVETTSFLIKDNIRTTKLSAGTLLLDSGAYIQGQGNHLYLYGDVFIQNNITSPVFTSGFAGTGWAILKDESYGGFHATFDELTIRKKMRIYELEIQKISATNGSIWVSDSCSGDSVVALN